MDQRATAVKICPACHTAMVEGACYCHMCGMSVKAALEDALRRMREGEIPLYSYSFQARGEDKVIEVWCHDLTAFPRRFDLLTISAYQDSYNLKSKSVIGALWRNLGFDTGSLLEDPFIIIDSVETTTL